MSNKTRKLSYRENDNKLPRRRRLGTVRNKLLDFWRSKLILRGHQITRDTFYNIVGNY